jgi:hypothetical protein
MSSCSLTLAAVRNSLWAMNLSMQFVREIIITAIPIWRG